MAANSFYTNHTLYIDGKYFPAGRWTEAFETPELAAKTRSGLMTSLKPIDQVENYVAPALVTLQTSPQSPIIKASEVQTPVVHPTFAQSFAPVVEIPVEETVVETPVEETVVEETVVETPVLKRKGPKA